MPSEEVDLLVEGKGTPECCRLDSNLIFITAVLTNTMKTHLNSKTDALTSIIPALRIPTAAGFSDGHDTESLDGGERVVILFNVEQPLAFLKEVIPRCIGIVGISSCVWLTREPATQGQ
jgi:hypothetical protein